MTPLWVCTGGPRNGRRGLRRRARHGAGVRQDTSHEGVPVGPGNLKIIIRTDVMYERVPPVFIDDVGKQAYDLHREAQSAEGEGDHMTAMKLYRHCRRLCRVRDRRHGLTLEVFPSRLGSLS